MPRTRRNAAGSRAGIPAAAITAPTTLLLEPARLTSSTPSTTRTRLRLTARILLEFVWLDLVGRLGFKALRRAATRVRVRVAPDLVDSAIDATVDSTILEDVREAVRDACVVYFKPVLCLQRSVAAARVLKRRGVPAQVVIGCRAVPIASHAWVEVRGEIVSDRLTDQAFYLVIDRW
jgi:hypothetical protein